ncbi:MAG: hypothetical protein KDB86_03860 [Actinobacteria bacterium]|nr:hypothetical protein [Actinomycetota bacterium]
MYAQDGTGAPHRQRVLLGWMSVSAAIAGALSSLSTPQLLGPTPVVRAGWWAWVQTATPDQIGVNLAVTGALFITAWIALVSALSWARLMPPEIATRLPGLPRYLRLVIAQTAVLSSAFGGSAGAVGPPPSVPVIVDAGGHEAEANNWAAEQAQRVLTDIGVGPPMGLQRVGNGHNASIEAAADGRAASIEIQGRDGETPNAVASVGSSELGDVDDPTLSAAGTAPGPAFEQASDSESGSHALSDEVWEVRAGEHFWAIAERVVALRSGTTPNVQQVGSYWRKLIDVNIDLLVDPGNPDLIMPGQIFRLPAT